MNSPQVLQIIPSIASVYGGPSQMVRGFSRALAEAGATVTIATTDANGDADQPPLTVPLGQPVFEDEYTLYYFRCAPFRRYKFSPALLAWLLRHGREYDIAHIHALFSPISTAAATVARWQGIPYLLRPLGTLDPADLAKKRQLKQLYGQLLERPNLAGAAGVHFTTPREAEISYRFGASTQDYVIPLGVEPIAELDPERAWEILQELKVPDYCPRILFLSRIDPKKGLDTLIDVLTALQLDGTEFHWILAGSNPQDPDYEQAVQTRISESPLASRTTLTGFVSGETKSALLQTADVFVLPSAYENFGIAVAEAMLSGLPVIISKGVYIWPEVARAQAGWVHEHPEELAQALRQALASRSERQTRGRNARQCAQSHYSWKAIARQTLGIYEQILT